MAVIHAVSRDCSGSCRSWEVTRLAGTTGRFSCGRESSWPRRITRGPITCYRLLSLPNTKSQPKPFISINGAASMVQLISMDLFVLKLSQFPGELTVWLPFWPTGAKLRSRSLQELVVVSSLLRSTLSRATKLSPPILTHYFIRTLNTWFTIGILKTTSSFELSNAFMWK